ncbi:hypothetical protein [Hyphomicrobium sp. MC1]|uniref:hypothetical protein n=1 Tax=Hyphomicrobium sp. (strain MC1) TaxID=717785 RepID=UPI000213E445|nr:hypothetical protein [Hyphomicrobium sp. MC1]CCB66491.1 protein of unknown function [Hyphomicrobium sp. MC1]
MFENIDWKEVHDYQPLIVGSLAFVGVFLGLLGNGYLQRRAHKREIKHKRNTVAAALAGELKNACLADLEYYRDQFDDLDEEPAILMRTKPRTEIYESLRHEIGRLQPYQIDYVIAAYSLVSNLVAQDRLNDDIANPNFGILELDSENVEAYKEQLADAIEAVNKAITVLTAPVRRSGRPSRVTTKVIRNRRTSTNNETIDVDSASFAP